MATTRRTLIRIEEDQAAWFKRRHGRSFPLGSWVAVENCARGREFSRLLRARVLELSLQSSVDQIWIHGFVDGAQTRELLFDQGAWQIVSGEPFEFEDTKPLRRWLARKRLLSSDGEDVFAALLGKNFELAGTVAEAHLRADITPKQLEAEAAEAHAQQEAAAKAEREQRANDFSHVYALAEPSHRWARALNPTRIELPAWVVCEYLGPPAVLSAALGCKVLLARYQRGMEFSVSVFEGENEVRMIFWHAQMSRQKWSSEGEPLPFEDHARLAAMIAIQAEPQGREALSAFMGPSARFTSLPLTETALEKQLERHLRSQR